MPRAQAGAQAPTPPSHTGAVGGDERADRDDLLYADVSARLWGVCAAMPPDAFHQLVRDICAMKRRWEASDYGPS